MEVSQSITRKSASNLALAFIVLPREKRRAMATLYAFCREVDDIADREDAPVEERREALQAWREDLQRAGDGQMPRLEVVRELQPVIQKFGLPFPLLDELLNGVEMDLDVRRYPSYELLEQYCYRVASVVGLLSLEIFGYRNPQCQDYAVYLGKAFQLTNILRDIGADAERDRIYIPETELKRFDVSEAEILERRSSSRFRKLAESVGARARAYFQRARESLPPEDRAAMAAAELMGSVYWQLLNKIARNQYAVLTPPKIQLSKAHKLRLILRSLLQRRLGRFKPGYGSPERTRAADHAARS